MSRRRHEVVRERYSVLRSLAGRVDSRSWHVVFSLVTGLGVRGAAFVTQIVAVPLLLSYLGREGYGVYETLTSLALWLGLTHGGMNLGLFNALIDANVSDDREGGRKEVASTLFPMLGLVAFMSLACVIACEVFPWTRLFPGVEQRWLDQIPMAAIISTLAVLLSLIAAVPGTVYDAHRQNHKNNLWDFAARAVSIVACVFVVRFTAWGLIGAAIAMAMVPVVVRLGNGITVFAVEKPWLRPRIGDFEKYRLIRNLRQSVTFLGIQAATFALFQFDRLIVSAQRGPTDAAQYAVVARIFSMAYGAFSIVYTPIWVENGAALRRGDVTWIRRSVRTTLMFGGIAGVSLGLVLGLAGDRILRLWTHTSMTAPLSVTLAFTATFLVRVWVDARSLVLHSIGVLIPQLAFWVAQALIAVPLAIWLGRIHGDPGVAWAVPIAAAPTMLWGFPWLLRRYVLNLTDFSHLNKTNTPGKDN